jgi:hypothetical protein
MNPLPSLISSVSYIVQPTYLSTAFVVSNRVVGKIKICSLHPKLIVILTFLDTFILLCILT